MHQLPLPDAEARARSAALTAQIVRRIDAGDGYIDFATFMECALYTPQLGYYQAAHAIFGAQGDFITAPECSALFSYCLANQCAEILCDLSQSTILELGAGSGRMAIDLLTRLTQLDALPDRYLIFERSIPLRQRQQQIIAEQLPQLRTQISWLTEWSDAGKVDIVLANEVLDAQPARRFIVQEGALYECCVAAGEDTLQWCSIPLPEPEQQALCARLGLDLQHLPTGYLFEHHDQLLPWLTLLSQSLSAQGTAILIDYGYPASEYYHPQRSMGSLLCHYQHRVHADPFFYPGTQDISVSVNFSWLSKCAHKLGLSLLGYTSQAYFLLGNGMDAWFNEAPATSAHFELSQQAQQLLLPGAMGERFKVIALGRGATRELSGFRLSDEQARL